MVLYHHYQVNPGYLKTIEGGPHVQGTFVLFQHNVGLKTYFLNFVNGRKYTRNRQYHKIVVTVLCMKLHNLATVVKKLQ